MKRTQVYEANDGTKFSTSDECKKHEEISSLALLERLSPEDINEALQRTNIPLADAFERIGNIIAERRRQSGGLKRAKSKKPEAAVKPLAGNSEKTGKPDKQKTIRP
jgi:hypothetical protein